MIAITHEFVDFGNSLSVERLAKTSNGRPLYWRFSLASNPCQSKALATYKEERIKGIEMYPSTQIAHRETPIELPCRILEDGRGIPPPKQS